LEKLKNIYNQALTQEDVVGLVIGTRPDCIDEEKLDYFAQLSKKYHIIIEYGIESCNNDTLQLIRRGHTFEQAVKALKMTAQAGIKTGAHFIFGLPKETPADWLQWANIISKLPLNTVKFHQLQFLKGTAMAELYKQNPEWFHHFSLAEYIDFIVDFVERLNPNIVIERFAGEVPPRFLSQPAWGLIRNDQILQAIEKKLEERGTYQGRRYL